ncbi:glycosyltransferase, partial [Candidatus Parcubacteria bacterium]|nr:glycosyltransferase [Candidatus Parcubacteria bacterium]
MKILFGGGASGGHFYPIIAVAEELNEIIEKEKILEAKLYFLSPTPYNPKALFDQGIAYKPVAAGKMRRYFSIANAFDAVKSVIGAIQATITMFFLYPDVVFGKGGYASFPALFAARLLGVPVFIHESDSAPGRTNLWAAKFAKRIAISWEEASAFFPKDRTAYTGQPVRKALRTPLREGAYDYLKLDPKVPTILVLGGSQGAEIMNDVLLQALPELLKKYQIIHQAGPNNVEALQKLLSVILKDH